MAITVYRVGGAVRDSLLGYPFHETDWVVVGGSPEDLLNQGYQQVGRDFPVFLHPVTKEEYALARTERKKGHGYHGFEVHADPSVTLEQDLSRRDLTVNAMAMTTDGDIIDPYGGQADLQARVLRHVSPHFVEDPLRVLRVARFAARYHPMGFSIAAETMALMTDIVATGELAHLSQERIWTETERALGEQQPAVYFRVLARCNALQALFPALAVTAGIELLERATPYSDRIDVRWSALQNDTTLLGNSLRHLRNQYDKINELNDILMNKNSSMMSEVTEENRKLLSDLQKAQNELQVQEDSLRRLEATLNIKEADLNQVSMELENRAKRVDELEALIAQKDAAVNDLKNRVSAALLGFKDKGLTVEQKNGKVYVSLDAKLLFPSGSTVIDKNGKQALIDLATAIEGESDLEVIVEGHTDTDAIRSNNIPRDNWELSVLRATSVVKIMMENSSIQPKILSASGRSEFHPVDPEDKAKNRRIEIILSPNLNELFDLIDGE